MARTLLYCIGFTLLVALTTACQVTAGDFANKATPAPSWPLTEVITADVSACEPQTVSGDSMVKTIMGSNLLTFVVAGPDGDQCLFDFTNETGTAYTRFACRVPRSEGKVTVFQFDKGVTDIHGYRYGHQFSWDLERCALAECSEGTLYPADCPRR